MSENFDHNDDRVLRSAKARYNLLWKIVNEVKTEDFYEIQAKESLEVGLHCLKDYIANLDSGDLLNFWIMKGLVQWIMFSGTCLHR